MKQFLSAIMMTLLLMVTLMLGIAQADDKKPETDDMIMMCGNRYTHAIYIMKKRQARVSIHEMMSTIKDNQARLLIVRAYKKPVFDGVAAQYKMVEKFADQISAECYEEFLRPQTN